MSRRWRRPRHCACCGTFDGEGGQLVTTPHTRNPGPITIFEDRESGIGFSGTFTDDTAEAGGTALLGKVSLAFRVTLRRLADE